MSVQKRTTKRANGTAHTAWRVRWMEGNRQRSRTFDQKRDALLFDSEVRRRRRLGPALAALDNGTETLDTYVTEVWAPTFAALLGPKTRKTYSSYYDHHISPTLGCVPLRDFTAENVGRWQSDRLAAGGGPVAVRQALTLLGSILQRAVEAGRIPANPARLVRKVRPPRRAEVRPLAPATVEALRAAATERDAVLISVLAYAGLRPGEALALRWGAVRERTILVERSLSMGVETDTKTTAHRTVRLLSPLATDLREWRMRCGRPDDEALVFPSPEGRPWTQEAYKSWVRKGFDRAAAAAGIGRRPQEKPPNGRRRTKRRSTARPYDLRHSFASLLLHEGRSVIYVARQLGHGAQLTLSTYGHVIDELEDAPHQDAETTILAARASTTAHSRRPPIVAGKPGT